jgi:hypothetical protein
MRSRSFLFEDEPAPHQPRNTHLVVVASIHQTPLRRFLGTLASGELNSRKLAASG